MKAGFLTSVFVALAFHAAQGMDCSLGQARGVVENLIANCPRPIIDSSDESYCCWDHNSQDLHCCTFMEFMTSSPAFPIILFIACVVVVIILTCICCICCCRCCCRRKNNGMVLVPSPMVLTGGPYSHNTPPYQPLTPSDGPGRFATA